MALDFPSSPTNGQTYTSGGKTWTWSSSTTSWESTPPTTSPQTANYIYASPNGSTGVPSFRPIVGADFGTQTGNTVLAAPQDANGTPSFRSLYLTDIPSAWVKKSVEAATTASLTLNSAQTTIDGVTLSATSRVLVKNQGGIYAYQNGIYNNLTTTSWVRTDDANVSGDIAGAFVNVDAGTVNGGKVFDNDFKSTDILGTTVMNWFQNVDVGYFTTVGNNFALLTNPSAITFLRINADNTLSTLDAATFRTAIGAGTSSTTGTVTNVATGTGLSGGPITGTGTIALANTAVTAGSYTNTNITVDAQGRITAAASGSGGGYGTATLRNVTAGYTSGGQVFITGTAPTASAAGDLWLDTSGTDSYTQALSFSGYTKLPNGFMMVWNSTASIPQDSAATQTFPYSFPIACLHVFITLQGALSTNSGGSDNVTNITTTSFSLQHGSDPARTFSYIAIGY